MFTLRRQLTALTLVAASVLSVPAMADTSSHNQLENYLGSLLNQQMTAVKAEVMNEVTVEVAQTTYLAEPEMTEETLVADVTIRDLNRNTAMSDSGIKGE